MAEKRADNQMGADPTREIACPVCATFNPSAFRFCPQCGHRLRVPHLRERPAARTYAPSLQREVEPSLPTPQRG